MPINFEIMNTRVGADDGNLRALLRFYTVAEHIVVIPASFGDQYIGEVFKNGLARRLSDLAIEYAPVLERETVGSDMRRAWVSCQMILDSMACRFCSGVCYREFLGHSYLLASVSWVLLSSAEDERLRKELAVTVHPAEFIVRVLSLEYTGDFDAYILIRYLAERMGKMEAQIAPSRRNSADK